MSQATVTSIPTVRPGPFNLTGLLEVYYVALKQLVRGKKLWVLGALFLLPGALVILIRSLAEPQPAAQEMEFVIILYLIPHTILPFAALLFSSGMIQDEIEEQTLTYLLIRPLPRWGIYLAKLAASICVTCLLTAIFVAITYIVIYWKAPETPDGPATLRMATVHTMHNTPTGQRIVKASEVPVKLVNMPPVAKSPGFWNTSATPRAGKTIVLFSLSSMAYCSLFGLMGLAIRRSLIVGLAYIMVMEGLFANLDLVVRRGTIMFYYRILSADWLNLKVDEWFADRASVPDVRECLYVLGGITVVAALVAVASFTTREFRVKTPEGS